MVLLTSMFSPPSLCYLCPLLHFSFLAFITNVIALFFSTTWTVNGKVWSLKWFLVISSLKWFLVISSLKWFLVISDLLRSLPWGWLAGGQDSSVEATIYLVFSFSPGYHIMFWEKIRIKHKMGKISRESCSADEWHSSHPMHPWVDENFDRFERIGLEGGLEYHSKVLPITAVYLCIMSRDFTKFICFGRYPPKRSYDLRNLKHTKQMIEWF